MTSAERPAALGHVGHYVRHPAAKRWQDWYATEVFSNIRRREMLNRIHLGLGDDLAGVKGTKKL
ncbi:MAG: hypothetical protein ACRERE_30020 [Candidatus Entotheonellia bacterium]